VLEHYRIWRDELKVGDRFIHSDNPEKHSIKELFSILDGKTGEEEECILEYTRPGKWGMIILRRTALVSVLYNEHIKVKRGKQ